MKILKILSEYIVLISIIIAFNYILLPENMGFIRMSPNPFWIPIVAFSLRYPKSISFLISSLTSLIYIFFFVRSEYFIDYENLIEYQNIALIIAFNFIAFFLSQKIDGLNEFINYLQNKVRSQRENIKEFSRTVETQDRIIKEFEQKLSRQSNTISTIYGLAKNLDSLDYRSIIEGLFDAMISFVNVSKISFYHPNSNKMFTLSQSRGWTENGPPVDLDITTGLAEQALIQKKVVWIRHLEGQSTQSESSILCCGPLILEDDQLVGLICIHEMPFINFNRDLISFFEILLEWTSRSWYKAKQWQVQKENEIYDLYYESYHQSFLKRHLKMEISNFQRYQKSFSLVMIEYVCPDFLEKADLKLITSMILGSFLRTGDIIFNHIEDKGFIIFLPSTPEEGAKIASQKIIETINTFYSKLPEKPLFYKSSTAIHDNDKKLSDLMDRLKAGLHL